MKTQLLVTLVLSFFTTHAVAETPRRLEFKSKHDQFELVLTGNKGKIAGKVADLENLQQQLAMLSNPLGNGCPPFNEPPDVTVKEGARTRSIYIRAGIVAEGENCLNVGGEGLLYFPLHRDFLVGPKVGGIALQAPVKIFRQGVKLFELKGTPKAWSADGTNLLLNWDFLDRFLNSLKSYTIRSRANLGLAVNKPKMIIQVGTQSFEFYKITNVVWALKRPGVDWLETSDDWSFWYDLDDEVLEDPYSTQIRFLQEPGQEREARLAALSKMERSYSRNLRDLYHHLVLKVDEDEDIKKIALQRLKARPVKETALAMARYLQVGDNEEFKRVASQILKINQPKGPLYKPTDTATKRNQTVEYWQNWADKNQP